jgi:Glyoxalase/Bleomycin resistance protein/Dioxygenase superfamily
VSRRSRRLRATFCYASQAGSNILTTRGFDRNQWQPSRGIRTKGEVDAVMTQATRAGAVVVQPAHDTLWGGYAGSFQDPDGHLWEVAWIPSGWSKRVASPLAQVDRPPAPLWRSTDTARHGRGVEPWEPRGGCVEPAQDILGRIA